MIKKASTSHFDLERIQHWIQQGIHNQGIPAGKFRAADSLFQFNIESPLADHIEDVFETHECWLALQPQWLALAAKTCGVTKNQLATACINAILFHDIGKASFAWQEKEWCDKHTLSHAYSSFLILITDRFQEYKNFDWLLEIIPLYATISHHTPIDSEHVFCDNTRKYIASLLKDIIPDKITFESEWFVKIVDGFVRCDWLTQSPPDIDSRLFFDIVRYQLQVADRLGSAFLKYHVIPFIKPFQPTDHIDAKTWQECYSQEWAKYRKKHLPAFVKETYFKEFHSDHQALKDKIRNLVLYPIQKSSADLANVQNTKGLLIIHDTGGGKTAAGFVAALSRIENEWAMKMVYVTPTRMLGVDKFFDNKKAGIKEDRLLFQNADLFEQIYSNNNDEKDENAEHDSSQDDISLSSAWVDNTFNRFITITTPDQLLLAWHTRKPKISHAQRANLTSCVIIFDEVHSYNDQLLIEIKALIPDLIKHHIFVIGLSATLPQKEIDWYKQYGFEQPEYLLSHKKNTFIKLDKPFVEEIEYGPSNPYFKYQRWQVNKEIIFQCISQNNAQKVIIYVNRVEEVQAITACLQASPTFNPFTIIGLHARFTMSKRAAIEKEILKRFDKDADDNKTIVIMNQAGILGLDISSDVMISKAGGLRFYSNKVAAINGESGVVIIISVYLVNLTKAILTRKRLTKSSKMSII